MAQLSDDCFAFGGPLMTVAEAEAMIAARVQPVTETELVAVRAAQGRTIARDIAAPVALPPFDNSAVDGYAVRFADLVGDGPSRFRVSGRLQAGQAAAGDIKPNEAIRIFTGAPMPPGADTVFMQEDVTVGGHDVLLPAGLKRGANRRLAGEDIKAGDIVLAAGTRILPQHAALASATGLTSIEVRRRIKVALFSTGDEIAEPGAPLKPGTIYDANRSLLAAMVRALGADVSDLGILKDDPKTLEIALRDAAASHDMVLTTGGVSTGEADYVKAAVEAAGRLDFWRVAIKPGRPVALGVLGQRAVFAGLPGNPVAAFVTFARIVRPILSRLSGAAIDPLHALPVRCAFSYKKKAGRREYVRVSLQRGVDGVLEAVKYKQDGAGVITSLTATDGLVELPEEMTEVSVGATAGFLPYAVILGAV